MSKDLKDYEINSVTTKTDVIIDTFGTKEEVVSFLCNTINKLYFQLGKIKELKLEGRLTLTKNEDRLQKIKYKILKKYDSPNIVIHPGVIKSRKEWIEFFPGINDLNKNKDWFEKVVVD